jgi:hypothetical protein
MALGIDIGHGGRADPLRRYLQRRRVFTPLRPRGVRPASR